MILLAGFYRDADAARRAELLECVRRNGANGSIAQIHVFVEEREMPAELAALRGELPAGKLRFIPHGRRLTYQDLFAYAGRKLAGETVVAANADIFFDHTLARLEGHDLSGKLLCLSRWELDAQGRPCLYDFPSSQDAWIFKPPLPPFPCDFHLGVPGCDNRLAWEAAQAGLAVSNPSRSVRACHLHASGVHRYTEAQRIRGATLAVAPGSLGARWLWWIVPCRGRLQDLQSTMGTLLAQPKSSYVLVDYGCLDGCGAWAAARYPAVTVARAETQARFHGAQARNLGAALADDGGILCFLDADVAGAAQLAEELLSRHAPGSFLVPDRDGPGLSTALACGKEDFERAGGFDEAFQDFGEEVKELRGRLARAGLVRREFPSSLLRHEPRRARRTGSGQRALVDAVHGGYRRAKRVLQEECGGDIAPASRREIYDAIFRHRACAGDAGALQPCAAAAFHETMGYTVAKLEAGVSSHNNEERPFCSIPRALAGRCFTQVVAYRVSPVEVELLEAGMLYVLVGTDWDGYHVASAWLRETGRAEMLPTVRTRRGTAFEVWSLAGAAGTRFTAPTQVMLVADRLVRR